MKFVLWYKTYKHADLHGLVVINNPERTLKSVLQAHKTNVTLPQLRQSMLVNLRVNNKLTSDS